MTIFIHILTGRYSSFIIILTYAVQWYITAAVDTVFFLHLPYKMVSYFFQADNNVEKDESIEITWKYEHFNLIDSVTRYAYFCHKTCTLTSEYLNSSSVKCSFFSLMCIFHNLILHLFGLSFAELYFDWVAPALQTSLLVETWRNGRGKLPSSCNSTFMWVQIFLSICYWELYNGCMFWFVLKLKSDDIRGVIRVKQNGVAVSGTV
jgi:hypothetical protein